MAIAVQGGAQGLDRVVSVRNWAVVNWWQRIDRGTEELGGEQGKKKEGDGWRLGRLKARTRRLDDAAAACVVPRKQLRALRALRQ